ncbi:MAG: hypothetical protein KDJ65_17035 [Anaerolineae bacterium]|nr:hypothetical protein [Anaerolineae bacterium]
MWQPQLTRRLRVLLHARPLLKLRDWDKQRDPDTRHYDSVALAMQVLDYIIESMGLGVDADSNDATRVLAPSMSQMDILAGIPPDAQRHSHFTAELLGRLRNDKYKRHPFKIEYFDFDENKPIRRQLELRLIEERFASDDRIVLQLSSEAINLLLNALDLDIEDAQTALEAVDQSQLKRGRFKEAAASARDARLRSIQLANKIERILQETHRDMSRVDWRREVLKILDEALEHIKGRLQVEKDIADSARQKLDELEQDSDGIEQIALIAKLMDDCFDEHTRLHEILMKAPTVFFKEQDRQAFMPQPSKHLPNLFIDVLEPLLALSVKDALKTLDGDNINYEGAATTLRGANAPKVFSLKSFISWALQPRREQVLYSVPDEEQIWTEHIPDVLRYPPEVQQKVQSYLAPETFPIQLSTVLKNAINATEPQPVAEYISLQTLQVFENSSATTLQAEPTGTTFEYAGFYGDDLKLDKKQSVEGDNPENSDREGDDDHTL